MRCFAPIQAVITFSLADLFLELKAMYYRRSKVQNMGGVKMTFHKFIKGSFLRNRIQAVVRCNFFVPYSLFCLGGFFSE